MNAHNMTIADSMALAVLRKDWVAAYALADKLLEQRDDPSATMEQQAAAMWKEQRRPFDGYQVYQWPEFIAFAKRLGFAWDLRTRDFTIRFAEGEAVVIQQEYLATDRGPTT